MVSLPHPFLLFSFQFLLIHKLRFSSHPNHLNKLHYIHVPSSHSPSFPHISIPSSLLSPSHPPILSGHILCCNATLSPLHLLNPVMSHALTKLIHFHTHTVSHSSLNQPTICLCFTSLSDSLPYFGRITIYS